jgi:hypothetical protein
MASDDRGSSGKGEMSSTLIRQAMAPSDETPGPVQAGVDGQVPPLPPGIIAQQRNQISLAVGALHQPNVLTSLSDPAKKDLLEYLDKSDERGFKHAQEHIQSEERIRIKGMEDKSCGRRQVLILMGSLAGGVMVFGVGIACLLIAIGKADLAHSLLIQGVIALCSLLGGVGLAGLLRKHLG